MSMFKFLLGQVAMHLFFSFKMNSTLFGCISALKANSSDVAIMREHQEHAARNRRLLPPAMEGEGSGPPGIFSEGTPKSVGFAKLPAKEHIESLLVEAQSDTPGKSLEALLKQKNKAGRTLLMLAVFENELQIMQILLQAAAGNFPTENNYPTKNLSSSDLVKQLLADTDKDGNTMLGLALENKQRQKSKFRRAENLEGLLRKVYKKINYVPPKSKDNGVLPPTWEKSFYDDWKMNNY